MNLFENFLSFLTMVPYKLSSLVLYFHICKMDLIIAVISLGREECYIGNAVSLFCKVSTFYL